MKMKKGIEWLVRTINLERESLRQRFESGKETVDESAFNDGKDNALTFVLRLIEHLDEPEVLSQEWIDEHKVSRINNLRKMTMSDVVPVGDLQNLLVPKKEPEVIPEVLSQEWISDHIIFNEKEDAEYIYADKLQNLLVPKQEEVDRAYKDGYEKGKEHTFYKGYLEGLADKEKEPETVASVIADFYKSFERFKEVISMEVEELEE